MGCFSKALSRVKWDFRVITTDSQSESRGNLRYRLKKALNEPTEAETENKAQAFCRNAKAPQMRIKISGADTRATAKCE